MRKIQPEQPIANQNVPMARLCQIAARAHCKRGLFFKRLRDNIQRSRAFATVTWQAGSYEIVDVIASAFCDGNDMVNLKNDCVRWRRAAVAALEAVALENVKAQFLRKCLPAHHTIPNACRYVSRIASCSARSPASCLRIRTIVRRVFTS